MIVGIIILIKGDYKMIAHYKVIINGTDSGIIETNLPYAREYWEKQSLKTNKRIHLSAVYYEPSEIERLHFDSVISLLWKPQNEDHDKLETALISMKMAVAHSSDNMELLDELEFLIENWSLQK